VLQIARWAHLARDDRLDVDTSAGPIQMAKSQGTATPLLSIPGRLGADMIRFAPGKGVPAHTHAGRHVLLTVAGRSGNVNYDGADHRLEPGVSYFVAENVMHSIDAGDDAPLVLLAVGDGHVPANDPSRLKLETELND
jgi:quercetin dioxygenase-like cupin family protein